MKGLLTGNQTAIAKGEMVPESKLAALSEKDRSLINAWKHTSDAELIGIINAQNNINKKFPTNPDEEAVVKAARERVLELRQMLRRG